MCTYMTAIEAEKELQAARELDGFTGKLEKSYISRMVKDAKRNSMIGDKIQIVVNPIYIHIPKWQRKMNKVRAYNIGHSYNKYKWDVPKVLLYNDQLWVIDGQHRIFGAFKGGKDAVVVEIMECSMEEAVRLFMNQTKDRGRMYPIDIYNAALDINDPVATAIRDICHKHNVAVKGEEIIDEENTKGILTPITRAEAMVKNGTFEIVMSLLDRLQWNGTKIGCYKGAAYSAKPLRCLCTMYSDYRDNAKEMEDILVEKCHGAVWFKDNGNSKVSEMKFLDIMRNIVNQELANRATKAEIIPVPVRKFA